MRGDDDPPFDRAVALFREIGDRVRLAGTLLEQAEWLVSQGRPDEAEPLLSEAREIFVPLRAKPWLERAAAISSGLSETTEVPA
jgi:hypothetical protein